MIVIEELSKRYVTRDSRAGHVDAMKRVNLTIEDGLFYVLLGPSGSGKTTTLRSVAGLEDPDEGEIRIGGQLVFSSRKRVNVTPEERPIAMVFQSYALWPHMNVASNITFPLRRGIRRVPAGEIKRRLGRVLELLNLADHAHRPISTLSGGQQQRVALARALALEPAVLLMDEPLSNLDAKLRAHLRVELKNLTQSIGITTIYVTHDQTEAMAMGDRIAVMDQGAIRQEGTPPELYQHPKNLFVARFLGDMNFLEGNIDWANGVHARVSTGAGPLEVVRSDDAPRDGATLVGFRPEDVTLVAGPGENVVEGRISGRHYLGDSFLYDIAGPWPSVQVKLPKGQRYEIGDVVFMHLPPDSCVAFRKEDGAAAMNSAL